MHSRVLLMTTILGGLVLGWPTSVTAACAPTSPCTSSNATVCVFVYGDINGDALRDVNEILLAKIPIRISTQTKDRGTATLEGETDMNGLKCFIVTPGDYKVEADRAGSTRYQWNSSQEISLTVEADNFYSVEFAASDGSLSLKPAKSKIDWPEILSILGIVDLFVFVPLMLLALVVMNVMMLRLLQATLRTLKLSAAEEKIEKSLVVDEPPNLPQPAQAPPPARSRSAALRKRPAKSNKPRATRRGKSTKSRPSK